VCVETEEEEEEEKKKKKKKKKKKANQNPFWNTIHKEDEILVDLVKLYTKTEQGLS
jgi:hypothetical protein